MGHKENGQDGQWDAWMDRLLLHDLKERKLALLAITVADETRRWMDEWIWVAASPHLILECRRPLPQHGGSGGGG